MSKSTDNYIYAYYQQIKDGSITVGTWIRRIYEYIVTGLQNKDFFFDQKKANHAVDWIEAHCFHTEGELAPNAIRLELWQKAFLSVMFGVVDKDGYRIGREFLLVVGRKNGKTLFAGSIVRYLWSSGVDGFGTRCYVVAPKLEQAELAYSSIWTMTTLDPDYQAKYAESRVLDSSRRKMNPDDPTMERHRQTDLYVPATNSTVKKIALNARKSDGLNPSIVLADEISSWSGDSGLKQYEVLKSGFGARREGILLSISTSGYVNDSIFDELMKRATRFLNGDSKERRLLPFLYMIDDVDKWNDINELKKANPNLGVSVSVDYMLEEIAIAEGSLSKKSEFLCKYCNVKQSASKAFLESRDIENSIVTGVTLESMRSHYCVCGVDLSRTTDLTAVTCVVEDKGILYVFSKFFMPRERLEMMTARDSVPYEIYVKKGNLVLSGDNFVDYNDCYQWLTELVEKYEILPLRIGYDRYNSQYLTQALQGYGFVCDDVFQGDNLSGVIDEFDGLLKDGKIKIVDNDLMKIHLYDSALKYNAESGRKKLIKLSTYCHVDGTAALLDALCVRQKWYSEIGEQLRNE